MADRFVGINAQSQLQRKDAFGVSSLQYAGKHFETPALASLGVRFAYLSTSIATFHFLNKTG